MRRADWLQAAQEQEVIRPSEGQKSQKSAPLPLPLRGPNKGNSKYTSLLGLGEVNGGAALAVVRPTLPLT